MGKNYPKRPWDEMGNVKKGVNGDFGRGCG